MILAIIASALKMVFMSVKTVEVIVPGPPLLALPAPETEESILQKAFGLLQRRITDALGEEYPDGRWVWSTQNAIENFKNNDPLIIFLKSASGHQKATVKTRNLLFLSLEYGTAAPEQSSAEQIENENKEPYTSDFVETYDEPEGVTTNYELVAYEWVSSNLISINKRCNEAIADGKSELFIPSEELPHPDSYFDICEELGRNEFKEVLILEGGIELKLPR